MPIEDFDIVGSYNNQRFTNIDAERTINMFEYIDTKGKKQKTLISTSGLENTGLIFPNAPADAGFRGEFVLNEFEYFVIGANIYKRDENNIVTKLNVSPIATSTGYIGIDANNAATGEQIVFVDGIKGYIWDTGTGIFTPDIKLIDPAFPASPIDVCFIDGFIVVAAGGTNTFLLSAFNNAYSWSLVQSTTVTFNGATDIIITGTGTSYTTGMMVELTGIGLPTGITSGKTYFAIATATPGQIKIALTLADAVAGTAINFIGNGTPPNTIRNLAAPNLPGQLQQGAINTHPGDIVGCRTLHRRVFLFSNFFIEIWENSGSGTNLPLRRNNGLLIELGTPSRASIATGFDKMNFLSQDRDGLGSVIEVVGTEPIHISTRALDFQLAQYASLKQVSDSKGFFVKENGIIFYRLNFTAANHTFVYNSTLSNPTSEEGKLWHEEQVLNGNRHPAQTHGFFNGNNFYGDYKRPILYQVDDSFVTNDGEDIPRIRIGRSFVPSTYNRTRIDRFMLDLIQGQALITNVPNLIPLLAENSNIIVTENMIDILLESSVEVPVYSIVNPTVFLSISKDGGVTYGYR